MPNNEKKQTPIQTHRTSIRFIAIIFGTMNDVKISYFINQDGRRPPFTERQIITS